MYLVLDAISTSLLSPLIFLKNKISLRVHLFNLKGWGVYGFFLESKYIFSLRSAAEFFFSRQVVATLFLFLQKQYFLKHKVLTEFFFCPLQRQKKISIKFADRNCFSPKNHSPLQVKWMFPYHNIINNNLDGFFIPMQ